MRRWPSSLVRSAPPRWRWIGRLINSPRVRYGLRIELAKGRRPSAHARTRRTAEYRCSERDGGAGRAAVCGDHGGRASYREPRVASAARRRPVGATGAAGAAKPRIDTQLAQHEADHRPVHPRRDARHGRLRRGEGGGAQVGRQSVRAARHRRLGRIVTTRFGRRSPRSVIRGRERWPRPGWATHAQMFSGATPPEPAIAIQSTTPLRQRRRQGHLQGAVPDGAGPRGHAGGGEAHGPRARAPERHRDV